MTDIHYSEAAEAVSPGVRAGGRRLLPPLRPRRGLDRGQEAVRGSRRRPRHPGHGLRGGRAAGLGEREDAAAAGQILDLGQRHRHGGGVALGGGRGRARRGRARAVAGGELPQLEPQLRLQHRGQRGQPRPGLLLQQPQIHLPGVAKDI